MRPLHDDLPTLRLLSFFSKSDSYKMNWNYRINECSIISTFIRFILYLY